MKSSKALRLARELIEDGHENFVCHALRGVGGRSTEVYRVLREMFGEGGTVVQWLEEEHPEVFKKMCDMGPSAREYRLAWIDWMIEGYKKVGD